MFVSFLLAAGLDVHWYDKIWGCVLFSLSFHQLNWTVWSRSLWFVAWSCLFRMLPWLHTLCFQFYPNSTFTFGQLSDVFRLAILTDVFVFVDKPCKRRYLCSRRSEQMVIELDSHTRVPSTFSHPRGPQFAHFFVFLGLMFSFVFFATVVAASVLLTRCASYVLLFVTLFVLFFLTRPLRLGPGQKQTCFGFCLSKLKTQNEKTNAFF